MPVKYVTITSIASEMGLSPTTIHKALNDLPGIHPLTKEKVQVVARRLGYRPNLLARGLRNKKTNIVGVLFTLDFGRRWYASLANKLIDGFKAYGYKVMLSLTNFNTPEEEKRCMEIFMGGHLDGVVAGPILQKSRLRPYQDVLRQELPIVFYGSAEELPTNFVDLDYVYSVKTIIDYLVSCGHERIGYMCGHDEPVVANTRSYGFQKAILEAGLRLKPQDLIYGRGTYKSGYEVMKKFLAQHDNDLPTAIFCHSDMSAIGAIKAAKEHGLSVPKDISIVGHDGVDEAEYCDPPLTTAGDCLDLLAMRLVKALVSQIDGDGGLIQEYIKPKLIIRNSVAVVKK